jgi:hypothetical protein
MKRWLSAAVILAISTCGAGVVAAAHCHVKKDRNCFETPGTVNFSSVSEISKQIVGAEPSADKPTVHTVEAPPITTYTGPTVGVSSMAHAPTVGYHWSLEPQADTAQSDMPKSDMPQSDMH